MTTKIKFTDKKWFVASMVVFCFPFGLFLMWKNQEIKNRTKVITTIAISLLVIASASNPEMKEIENSDPTVINSISEKPESKIIVQEVVEKPATLTPEQEFESHLSAWDGSLSWLKDSVRDSLNNPKSFEHVETTYRVGGETVLVYMTYRAENGFGAIITKTIIVQTNIKGEFDMVINEDAEEYK